VTTIAYRDGIIAADTGATFGGTQLARVTKIANNPAGNVTGGSGDARWCGEFLDWFASGENGSPPVQIDKDMTSVAMVARMRSHEIRMFESTNGKTGSFVIRAPYYAIGSGRGEALGAMWAGKSAAEAVAAAIALDEGTFGEIETRCFCT